MYLTFLWLLYKFNEGSYRRITQLAIATFEDCRYILQRHFNDIVVSF